MKLGNIVQHIRSGNSYKDKRDELDSMGFQFRVRAVKGQVLTEELMYPEELETHELK
jgi:hypothetical protein